ncbi:hypothetical protein ACFWWT_39450 [Streptomyces sp. NPDC058676]|uniref:hypothetical protein n=1 Tax=unclassified Streptomyces TaxID=2593676 RepID=UPI0036666FD1
MTTGGDARDAERRRLAEPDDGVAPWRRRGPYLSERQWGTVREGLRRRRRHLVLLHPRPGARSRAYRWGRESPRSAPDREEPLS